MSTQARGRDSAGVRPAILQRAECLAERTSPTATRRMHHSSLATQYCRARRVSFFHSDRIRRRDCVQRRCARRARCEIRAYQIEPGPDRELRAHCGVPASNKSPREDSFFPARFRQRLRVQSRGNSSRPSRDFGSREWPRFAARRAARSFSSELRRSLLEKRLGSFAHVARCREEREMIRFERETALE